MCEQHRENKLEGITFEAKTNQAKCFVEHEMRRYHFSSMTYVESARQNFFSSFFHKPNNAPPLLTFDVISKIKEK